MAFLVGASEAITSTPAISTNIVNTIVDRGNISAGSYADANTAYQALVTNGIYGVSNPGSDSRSVLVFNPGTTTSAGTIQVEFAYNYPHLRIRNKTDNATWTSFKQVLVVDGTGKVGINTTSPAARFHITGYSLCDFKMDALALGDAIIDLSVASGSRLLVASQTGDSYIWVTTNHALRFGTNNTERGRFSAAGGFSVGTTADPGAGAIYATGNITAYYSDKRLKDIKGKIPNALDKVLNLNGYYYVENETANKYGYSNKKTQVGVLAQEVSEVLPEIITNAPFDLDENGNSKSGENYMTVQYEKLVPLLIEAIKEQQTQIQELKVIIDKIMSK